MQAVLQSFQPVIDLSPPPSFPFMSSHHVVREKQEPALLIANGEACQPELLGQLLEWSPTVVVLDSAIWRVLDLGIKVDVLLGDFDRDLDMDTIRAQQYPLDVVHAPDQNKTDLQKGIEYLIGRGYPAVNVIWATGRRADHTITNLTTIVQYKDQIRIVMLDDYSKIFPLVGRFEKWYVAKTPISLIPVGTVEGVVTEGLTYNLHNESLTLGYRTGSSNEAAQDGFVRIEAQTGDLLIMECWD
jgi:thiamine pyrophosphokinase